MSSTPFQPVQPTPAQANKNSRLFGHLPKRVGFIMVIGTFFLLVPLFVWMTRGAFPEKPVNIVLETIGGILWLVSALMVKPRSGRLASKSGTCARA